MRRILLSGLCGLFLLTVVGTFGCDGSKPPQTPASMMDVPKQGPVAAGSGGGAGKSSTNVVPEKKNTND